jgi:hypothetical protein
MKPKDMKDLHKKLKRIPEKRVDLRATFFKKQYTEAMAQGVECNGKKIKNDEILSKYKEFLKQQVEKALGPPTKRKRKDDGMHQLSSRVSNLRKVTKTLSHTHVTHK